MQEQGRQPYNILKSTQLGSVKQSELSNIQKATFIENQAATKKNWNDLKEIKEAQLAAKTFGYGLPGPHAFALQSTNADSTQNILTPSTNEVYLINGLSVSESAGASAAAQLVLYDGSSSVVIWSETSIGANGVYVVPWSGELYLTENQYLRLVIGSGAVTVGVAYSKVVY